MRLNWVTPFQRATSREEPASQLETRQFPPTVLLKKWGSTRKGCLVISRFGRGADPGNTLFGIGMWSEPKPASNHACGIRVEDLNAINGVKAPGERMHLKPG